MWRRRPPRLDDRKWHLVVLPAVEVAAVGLRGSASPLLEEERNLSGGASVTKVDQPRFLDWPGTRATLTARDQPVDTGEVNLREGTEERFRADEPHGRTDGAEVVDAEGVAGVLHADAHPDVGWPVQIARDVAQPAGAFGEDLVGVLWRVGHHLEHPADEVERHVGMEEIAHRVDEHQPRRAPSVGDGQGDLVEGQRESGTAGAGIAIVAVLGLAHRLEPIGERERVAVVTARRRAVTTRGRVPRRLGPLDARTVGHGPPLSASIHGLGRTNGL